ncbi:MAG: preprotein translocase subunit SecG [Candidatus Omnitrophica bacterium CG07_land_8_20_14_0_80_50_8]|nr:MAG: preprotein translocase subunit SecG [Candidatus Omnitrophica bacterium CG07_land_8_20_14_0_80_50_8]
MQIFLIIVHVIACLFLIAFILLQAGRGGGLSDIAGGSQAQSILGTETNTFMKRLTEIFAVVFILTSLTLGIISTHRGKSLVEQRRIPRKTGAVAPNPAAPIKADTATAVSQVIPVAASPVASAVTAPGVAPEPKPSSKGNAK